MQIVLSGAGLRELLAEHAASRGYACRDEPCISDAFWAFTVPAAPHAWIIAAEVLDARAVSTVEAVHSRKLPVAVIVLFRSIAVDALRHAWPLARAGVHAVFSPDEALHTIDALQCSNYALAECVVARLKVTDELIVRLIRVLAAVPEAKLEEAAAIARRLHTSRPTLFRRIATAQLPGLEDLQILFRLLAAIALLQRGATTDNASYASGLSDTANMRKCFARKLGIGIAELSEQRDCDWIVDRWIERRRSRKRDAESALMRR